MCKPRTYLQIDTSALISNFNYLKSKLASDKTLMCVVKADCYGHGSECIKVLSDAGAEFFAVSSLEEAVEARKYTDKEILILSYTPPCDTKYLFGGNFIQTVYSKEYADLLISNMKDGEKLRVHIKIDTGMNRLGFRYDDENGILSILNDPHFTVEGMFTHFAKGDEKDKSATEKQLEKFIFAKITVLKNTSRKLIYHCANSGAVLDFPKSHMDMARGGISLYGLPPSDEISSEGLTPIAKLISTVVHVHDVFPNDEISYGGDFKACKNMKVATVACGYGDGLSRRAVGMDIEINGCKAKIIGRVCMDHFMVDVTDFEKIPSVGDEAVVFSDAVKYAEHIKTIPYECLCNVSKRVKRKYVC